MNSEVISKKIKVLCKKYFNKIVDLRHRFHMYPELAFNEINTSKTVVEELQKLNIDIKKNIAKTGVIGLLKGKYPGKTVLFRADMDALPINEEADVEYKSRVPGVMHACGHDGHTAALLGTAMVLNDLRDYIHGNVKFLFQPAEEGTGGAKPMIEEGALETPKVDAAFACHVDENVPEGYIRTISGPVMASSDDFTIKILGKGGHGAEPHLCIDPINIAIKVIDNIQSFVNRKIDSLNPYVISFCSINGGRGYNVIPDKVIIKGTLRTFDDEIRIQILNIMENVVKDITKNQGADYRFSYINFAPPLINNDEMTSIVSKAGIKMLGRDKVLVGNKPEMGAEDFAFFSKKVPSSMFFVGIKNKDRNIVAHNPYFQWEDKNLITAVQCFAQIVFEFLK